MGIRQSLDLEETQNRVGVFLPSLVEPGDECLLQALATGSPEAMEALYRRYGGLLYSLAYRMVNDHQVAEDLLQETFLAIWLHALSYSPQAGSVRSWFLALVRHRAIDYLRRVQRQSACPELSWEAVITEDEASLPSVPDAWEEVWTVVQRVQVREALLHLPSEQRLVILLVYFRGWTHTQIAQCYHLPCGTVKSRLRLGLLHLKQALDEPDAPAVASTKPMSSPPPLAVRGRSAAPVVVQMREQACPAGYELCQDGACTCFGYTEWQPLLEQIEAFEFSGVDGNFSARKVTRAHERSYWYAFRRGSAEKKRYLGKSTELTLPRLEAMARKLHELKPGGPGDS